MKLNKLIATLLSVVTVLGCFAVFAPTMSVAAKETEQLPTALDNYEAATELAQKRNYESATEFILDFLELRVTTDGIQVYANPFTGDVAFRNVLTGQILTTNPAGFGADAENAEWGEETSDISEEVKKSLLSQIRIAYKDEFGVSKTMNSFTEAAQRGQIVVKDIRNGIRVEYIIGRLSTQYLLPGYIMKDRFESEILEPIAERMQELIIEAGDDAYDPESNQTREEYFYDKFMADEYQLNMAYQQAYFTYMKLKNSYALQDPNGNVSTAMLENMQEIYPITKEKDKDGNYYAIYTLDEVNITTDKQKSDVEACIKSYCPNYGYDDLQADHEATGYEAKEESQTVFRLALEYVVEDGGISIRMPASGIRYDESRLTLENIEVLPYFGAGDMNDDGYVFFPDGTGAILEFEDLYSEHVKVTSAPSNKIYGEDYAYYSVAGSQHQETIRMPVYGVVSTDSVEVTEIDENGVPTQTTKDATGGYLAIMTEGDALTTLTAEFGATTHPFASVFAKVTPRPSDEYSLENAISASGSSDAKWTVVSDSKYIGNYKTKIIMLTDPSIGDSLIAGGDIDAYYRADWVGMATAYRDYLEKNGIIDRLTADDVKEDLPLYIETFGTIEKVEKFLSMPVTVDVALSKFSDVRRMYADLASAGISNVNFRLVGFANGGMDATYPAKLDWESAAGGDDGFEYLVNDAKKKGYGVYPDFDFLYINNTGWFDGISTKSIAVRTVDDRYASKQVYDAVLQDFFSYYSICVASSQLKGLFKEFDEDYSEYKVSGISLASLGDNLNSNFDEDDPTTREQAKEHYIELLKQVSKKYSLMTDGGNIFAATYTDHMLNAPIESSNYSYASHTVPFFGMVLHGYLNMAGSPLNEAGDIQYNIMKSIENGMNPYYVLAYNNQNTSLLKQDEDLSKYYSIRYDIWYGSFETAEDGITYFTPGELVKNYRLLNAAIGDLQTALITDYHFLIAERVRKESEIETNRKALLAGIEQAIKDAAYELEAAKIRDFRRDLDIYNRIVQIDQLTADADERLALLDEYLTDIEYRRDNIYDENDVKDAKYAFIDAIKIPYDALDDKTAFDVSAVVDTLALDSVTAASIADWTALAKAYRDKEKKDWSVELGEQFTLAIARYIERMAEMYLAGYDAGTFTAEVGKCVPVAFDRSAVIESLEAIIGSPLDAEQLAVVDAAIAASIKTKGDEKDTVTVREVVFNYRSDVTDSLATESEKTYVSTAYTLNDGSCVMTTYTRDNGENVRFILNYNLFDVSVNYRGDVDFSVTTFTDSGVAEVTEYKAGEIAHIELDSYTFVRID